MGKTICIDFDGVIHDYSNGYQGEDVFGSMVPNADAGTQALKSNGWTVIIFTTRKKSDKMEQWLKDHGISYDYINENPNQPKDTSGKIMADVYLDDRGIRFCGRWDKWLLEDIDLRDMAGSGKEGDGEHQELLNEKQGHLGSRRVQSNITP